MPGAVAPALSCAANAQRKAHELSQVQPNTSGIPRAMLDDLLRALLGVPGFVAAVPSALWPSGVHTSIGVSGPHGFVGRFRALRHQRATSRPSHPAPDVRDDAYVPLVGTGRTDINHAFLKNVSRIFSRRGLNRPNILNRLAKLVFQRAKAETVVMLSQSIHPVVMLKCRPFEPYRTGTDRGADLSGRGKEVRWPPPAALPGAGPSFRAFDRAGQHETYSQTRGNMSSRHSPPPSFSLGAVVTARQRRIRRIWRR